MKGNSEKEWSESMHVCTCVFAYLNQWLHVLEAQGSVEHIQACITFVCMCDNADNTPVEVLTMQRTPLSNHPLIPLLFF